MAPLCADPRQIVIALNPARRKALLSLVQEIISGMISELETHPDELGSIAPEDEGNRDDESVSPDLSEKAGRSASQGGRAQSVSLQKVKTTNEAEKVLGAALAYTLEWRDEVVSKLEEIVNVEETNKITTERKTRREALDKKKLDMPSNDRFLVDVDGMPVDETEDVSMLQSVYKPIPTKLTTIPIEDREEALGCVLLLLLSTGVYSAHSRALVLYLASSLGISSTFLNKEESEIAMSLMESSTANKDTKEAMSADAEAAKRKQQNKVSRFWKVGLASVAGAAVIGVTGGLAAPLVAGALGGILGGVGLGGVASFLGIFWMNGALVGTLFGAYGAKMTGEMMDNYAKEVEDFKFLPLREESTTGDPEEITKEQKEQRRLRVTIGINGWLNTEDDIKKPWRTLSTDTEVFALRYEMNVLLKLGTALTDLVRSVAWKAFKAEIIKRTLLATLWAALWPIQVLAVASNVDNPFNRGHNRSRKAGQLLADALINKVQGERPVTLMGYSLGAATIHACLQSLAERHAFGLVDTVILIGTPAPSSSAHWRTIRPVVSGKIFNVYSENDMVLGFVYRMHSLALGVAGLQPIKDVNGIVNVNLSDSVSGHLRYPSLTGEILHKCGFVNVKAGTEIETEEDVIQMKDKEADLLDFSEGHDDHFKAVDKSAESLQGLTITPPALLPSYEAATKPAISRRPVGGSGPESPRPPPRTAESVPPIAMHDEDEIPPPLPRRQTVPLQEIRIPRRPVPTKTEEPASPKTPLTPQYDSDDERHGSISMVDRDVDDD
ncbi:hypothetical protein TRIATDRAFT_42639 [Trichoderma atroviride IMI 206040]|uniref:Uncharacterized protein n=2 Tax=Hypocrea atroviridis TaxID=63577 RepID=G9P9P7_HYPAI|nr:uncharacterized protein TRIATDRAFT_42639 [Trichoderma atroviride IMI 206040]EHK40369.1 hypothetical protein TRIATDRAFT_42639 [Trichoderma atroviride IMI 206040]